MYTYNENNFINELIGYGFVEIFACIACIITAYYLCKVRKKMMPVLIAAYVMKIFFANIFTQWLTIKVFTGPTDRYYVSFINILFGMALVALVKVASPARLSEIFVMTLMNDALAIIFFIGPYYLIRHFLGQDQFYVIDSPNLAKSILMILLLMVIYTIGVFIIRIICKKLSKYYNFKHKTTRVIAYIVFIIALLSSFTNYYNDEAYKHGNLNVLFILIVVLGVIMPYLASVYSRKLDEKEEMERKEALLKEKSEIDEVTNASEKMREEDRKFRHDIDKHMNVIKEMVDEGATEEEVKEYAESIKETYK